MNEFNIDEIRPGMKASFTRIITKEMEDAFRMISGDENPLHENDKYATDISRGEFKSHVSFGMLTASLYSTIAGMYLPGKYSLIHSFDNISFTKPVFAGDKLSVEAEVTDKNEALKLIRIKAVIKNQDNMIVSKAGMKVLVLK